MRWVLVQYDLCLYNKGKLGLGQTYTAGGCCEDTGRRPSTSHGVLGATRSWERRETRPHCAMHRPATEGRGSPGPGPQAWLHMDWQCVLGCITLPSGPQGPRCRLNVCLCPPKSIIPHARLLGVGASGEQLGHEVGPPRMRPDM